jgi:hypothetical protein
VRPRRCPGESQKKHKKAQEIPKYTWLLEKIEIRGRKGQGSQQQGSGEKQRK